jgi:hypothetical protein
MELEEMTAKMSCCFNRMVHDSVGAGSHGEIEPYEQGSLNKQEGWITMPSVGNLGAKVKPLPAV